MDGQFGTFVTKSYTNKIFFHQNLLKIILLYNK